jgi:hypothetical protein
LSLKHDRVGAPYSPFDFTPLKVHSAISYGMGDADGSFAWDAFTHDPAPWLLADAINPDFWTNRDDFRAARDGNILVRALGLLGREEALLPCRNWKTRSLRPS